jgi:hypothetical protein
MPLDTVRLSFTSSDATEGTVAPATVEFTPADWSLPKRIYLIGVDDDSTDGDVGYAVAISATSGDPLYDGIAPDSIRIVNADDEGAVVLAVNEGWNLVSVPMAFEHSTTSAVFPTSISPAYAYDTGYVPGDTLRRGYGYWIRFAAPQELSILGDTTSVETVAVHGGWNLVGSISTPLAPADVIVDPPGIVASQFFTFDRGYHAVDTIMPGRGYWVKVDQAGTFVFSSGVNSAAHRITIIPSAEPPPPLRRMP